jgi:hypothetical protein
MDEQLTTPISFYLDDTRPDGYQPETFGRFVEFVATARIAGESSVILGSRDGSVLSAGLGESHAAYIEDLSRSREAGLDTHFELMTHSGLYDFARGTVPGDAEHEGVWLHEPGVDADTYEAYFLNIVAQGARIGVSFNGMTWPGCSCEACRSRYAQLDAAGGRGINPAVWEALLRVAEGSGFAGRTVPCFIGSARENAVPVAALSHEDCAVFDLRANARDRFGLWSNTIEDVGPDYYITKDGTAGRFVELLDQSAPYILFYAHWQGMNPEKGVGWDAFREVVDRVGRHMENRVTWVRPSEITDSWHKSGLPS